MLRTYDTKASLLAVSMKVSQKGGCKSSSSAMAIAISSAMRRSSCSACCFCSFTKPDNATVLLKRLSKFDRRSALVGGDGVTESAKLLAVPFVGGVWSAIGDATVAAVAGVGAVGGSAWTKNVLT